MSKDPRAATPTMPPLQGTLPLRLGSPQAALGRRKGEAEGALDLMPARQVHRAETWTGHVLDTEGIGIGNDNRLEAMDPKPTTGDPTDLRAPSGKSIALLLREPRSLNPEPTEKRSYLVRMARVPPKQGRSMKAAGPGLRNTSPALTAGFREQKPKGFCTLLL